MSTPRPPSARTSGRTYGGLRAHLPRQKEREREREREPTEEDTTEGANASHMPGATAIRAECNTVVESPKSALYSHGEERERVDGRDEGTKVEGWRRTPTRKRDRERTRSRWIMLNVCLNTCTPRDTHSARESRRHRAPFVFSIYIKSPLEWPNNGTGRTAPVRCSLFVFGFSERNKYLRHRYLKSNLRGLPV